MKILGVKIPEILEKFIVLLILLGLFWFYNNIAGITIFISLIIFLILFYKGLGNILNKYNYSDISYKKYKRNIGILLIVISLIPGYFAGYILTNYDESNKYLQEKSIGGIIEIGKFAISGKRFTTKNIMKQVESNVKDNLKEEAIKETIESLSGKILQRLDAGMTIQSGAINLNPTIK